MFSAAFLANGGAAADRPKSKMGKKKSRQQLQHRKSGNKGKSDGGKQGKNKKKDAVISPNEQHTLKGVVNYNMRDLQSKVESNGATFKLLQDTLTHIPLRMVQPFVPPMRRKFSVQLPELPSQEQGSSGRCWIFAGINVLRRLLLDRYDVPEDFNLSHSHVFFHAWLEKCNAALETAYFFHKKGSLTSAEFQCAFNGILSDGGTWSAFASVIAKHGIVPLEAFPDTRPAHSSSELNDILKIVMRLAVAELIQGCSKSSSPEDQQTMFRGIKDRAMVKVYRTLCAMLGTPPDTFEFDVLSRHPSGSRRSQSGSNKSSSGGSGQTGITGRSIGHAPRTPRTASTGRTKEYTPTSFYSQVILPVFNPDDYVCITNDPRHPMHDVFGSQYAFTVIAHDTNTAQLDKYPSNIFWNIELEAMKRAARKAVKAGYPLWFSCDVRKFYDDDTLLMNASASNIELLTGDEIWSASKSALYDSGAIENSHAMTIVGYDDATDSWKVDNSWGQSAALVMTGKWFDRFVVTVVTPITALDAKDAHAYRAKSATPTKVQHLAPPWDIYSSPQ
jgi:bleomycin hydrolase